MAKPPAGSSLLFGALADSGRIKLRKNGSYRMMLKGVDEIDWFTDRPDRVAGEWSPKKLVKKWDNLFGGIEPNAQATFEMGSKRKLVAFEMFKPKLSDSNQTLSFKVRGTGEKNKDFLTGLRNKRLSDASLFIDDSLPPCLPNCEDADLTNADLSGADLSNTHLSGANLTGAFMPGATLIDADLTGADLSGATLNWANLIDANLSGADLTWAPMIGANLTDADLTGANLTGANLYRANLAGATSDSTTTWPTAEYWDNTTCPDGTNSNDAGNATCGFKV